MPSFVKLGWCTQHWVNSLPGPTCPLFLVLHLSAQNQKNPNSSYRLCLALFKVTRVQFFPAAVVRMLGIDKTRLVQLYIPLQIVSYSYLSFIEHHSQENLSFGDVAEDDTTTSCGL